MHLELREKWSAARPLPRRGVRPDGSTAPPPATAFDFTHAMRSLILDITRRCPTFAHIDIDRLLVGFTPSRNRNRYGLQARVTPLRFPGGALTRRKGGTLYGLQRYSVEGVELLYLIAFSLPRFLSQPFADKLVTVFHELFHISPAFDGDIRRHAGRNCIHGNSKADFDNHMRAMVEVYLLAHPNAEVFAFLKLNFNELTQQHGGVTSVAIPRPKLLPISRRQRIM